MVLLIVTATAISIETETGNGNGKKGESVPPDRRRAPSDVIAFAPTNSSNPTLHPLDPSFLPSPHPYPYLYPYSCPYHDRSAS